MPPGNDKRIHTPREGIESNKLFVLAGTLQETLPKHAFERCRIFFFFLHAIRALEFVNNEVQGRAKIAALDGFTTAATHQIDSGFRDAAGPGYQVFGADDVGVIQLPATTFTNTDAAHFCNLGIDPGFVGKLDLGNTMVADLYHELKAFAGATRWLPQLVNIGPDRVIDVLHGELATEFLADGDAIVSRSRIATYVKRVSAAMLEFERKKVKEKRRGVAACTRCYLNAYEQPNFNDRIFNQLSGAVAGWISAVPLKDVQRLRAHAVMLSYT